MVSAKIFYEYLSTYGRVPSCFYQDICLYETRIGIPFEEWDISNLFDFMKAKRFRTFTTAIQYVSNIKFFVKFLQKNHLCTEALSQFLTIKPDSYDNIESYMDIAYLTSLLCSYEEYQLLLSCFSLNVRDRLLVELSWLGLKTADIIHLKKEDVSIAADASGEPSAEIRLRNKTLLTYDALTIYDLQKVQAVQHHKVVTASGVIRYIPYHPDHYIIKTASIRKINDRKRISVNDMFSSALRDYEGKIPGIRLSELSLADIRKSKAVYLLSLPGHAPQSVAEKFHFLPRTLHFYQFLAKKKYNMV